jgi:cob(I)alamin adenosyltransferase
MLTKGYIQVYTGNGKGKTAAALGLALRSRCAGYKVYIGQFMKGQDYSELSAMKYFENLLMVQYGDMFFVHGKPSVKDMVMARSGLAQISGVLISGAYDVVIFDEINTAVYFNALNEAEVLEVLYKKPEHVEVILTGRYAPEGFIKIADLVTEMKEIKHYYNRGVPSRTGIEN